MAGQHEPLWKPEEKSGVREGKHFLLRMRHPWWCPLCRIKEWNVIMTTISWPTGVISHGWSLRHDKRISNDSNGQNTFKCWAQSSFYETLTGKEVILVDTGQSNIDVMITAMW